MAASGTLTFLFTDIEGSTALWDRFPRLMEDALTRHDGLLRDVFGRHQGRVFAAGGDGFGVAFGSVMAAVSAALDAQLALAGEVWPADVGIRVRMGLHSGVVQERDGDYFGAAVSKAARVCAAAGGGQVALSAAAAMLAADCGWSCVDVGQYSLKGFQRAERLFLLDAPGVNRTDRLRGADDAAGNLPALRMGLVGRERLLGRLGGLVAGGALVTLVGVGGVGKTRLAVSAAQAAGPGFSDGAWLVELAEVTSPAEVAVAVTAALQLRLAPGLDPASAIAGALGRQQRLLVFDNCEHVIDAAAEIIGAVRAHCPGIAIVATSRELLGLDGEMAVPVPPLGLEADDGHPAAAVRLFCDRLTGAFGEFTADDDELGVIADICVRLDGLPLAIELAAARVPALGFDEVRRGINDRFDLLTRRRGAADRHRSLRTTVSWSYELLNAAEQLLFDRLSVFSGSFDLAAAGAVSGMAPLTDRVDDGIAGLVERSMLTIVRDRGGVRYQMLETMRKYGEEQLHARGEAAAIRTRHLQHFLAWAGDADAGIRGRDELRWHRRWLTEWHNIRAAVGWAIEHDDGDAACTLIWRLHRWTITRHQPEAGEWADRVCTLQSAKDHPLRPIVLATSALFANIRGEWNKMRTVLHLAISEETRLGEAVEPFVPDAASQVMLYAGPPAVQPFIDEIRRRSNSDPFWSLMASRRETLLTWLIMSDSELPDDRADVLLDRARTLTRDAESFGNPTLAALHAGNLGAALLGRYPGEALAHLERALEISLNIDAVSVTGSTIPDLAHAYTTLARPRDALLLLAPQIRRYVRFGATGELANLFAAALRPLAAAGESRFTATLLGAVTSMLDRSPALQRSLIATTLEPDLRGMLGNDEFTRAFQQGRRTHLPDLTGDVLAAIDHITNPTAAHP